MRPTPAGYFWISYAIAFATLAALAMCSTNARAETPKIELAHPICPSGVWLAQRYDTRDKHGTITKAVWIARCVTTPRIVYASH